MSDERLAAVERQLRDIAEEQKEFRIFQRNFSAFESKILSAIETTNESLRRRGDDHDDIVRLQEQNKAKDYEIKDLKERIDTVEKLAMGSAIKVATVSATISIIMAFVLKTL
jgi:hypothetical protein